ncbi:unannotated protein [freshwater metagenome]|uniref:Unannotated protein n=1 Tax=freshwater metagenome TaxID=449393 RepID=A0A6J7C6C0_9ZZZZ
MSETLRNFFDVVGHEHRGRRVLVDGDGAEATHEILTASEIESCGGLIEQKQLGIGHQCARYLDAFALTLTEGSEPARGQRADPELVK